MGISFDLSHGILPHKCYYDNFAYSLFRDVILADDLCETRPEDLALSQKRSYYMMCPFLEVEKGSCMLVIGCFESGDECLFMKIFLG